MPKKNDIPVGGPFRPYFKLSTGTNAHKRDRLDAPLSKVPLKGMVWLIKTSRLTANALFLDIRLIKNG